MISEKANKTAKARRHPNYFLRLWTLFLTTTYGRFGVGLGSVCSVVVID